MALRDWIGRLRGREEQTPVTAPPAGPVAPAPPTGPPTVPTPAAPDIPIAPTPPTPPPYSPPTGPARLPTAAFARPTPSLDDPPARDDAGALAEALASSDPDPPTPTPEPRGWLARLRTGLSRSTARLTESVTTLFRKRRLDDTALEELEEMLITADLGVAAAARIVARFRSTRFGREVTDQEVRVALAEEIAEILTPIARPLEIDRAHAPHVVLVVGVNGTGKTTTIAKLGQQYRAEGLRCAFVAGDTFRAAAVEQLQIWGERTGCPVHAPQKPGADPAGLAFDALTTARSDGTDLLLIDTAGRLHNKTALMEELRKTVRVMQRVDATAPHSVLLVLDATTGQNAIQQCRVFKEMVAVTGLAVTKLDGSAKGGVVVALAQDVALPVHMVGVGESAADLRPFDARDFARSLVGAE